jgi:hypothetical protein
VNFAVPPTAAVALDGCVVIDGGVAVDVAVTVSFAVPLATLPTEFVTTTLYVAPSSVISRTGVVYVAEVAPAIGAPPCLHWYVSGIDPVATTLNVAVPPTAAVWLAGCVVIDGGVVAGGVVVVVVDGALLPPPP